ncbi:MAG: sulfatase [Verrucomicrobia bacterium]|nr:sulfatase [Verrucomicrobiota bacterium]
MRPTVEKKPIAGCAGARRSVVGRLAVAEWALFVLSLVVAVPVQIAGGQLPNVVFVLADDLGWTDLGCQGSRYYETPNIDRLASEGMRFTHGYSCGPNCQPTRAALMTGQYGPRTGIYTVGDTNRFDWSMRPLIPVRNKTELDPAKLTVAEVLQKRGYATGYFGKWHLGDDPKHHPLAQGFEEAVVSQGRHFRFDTTPHVDVGRDVYLADFLTDRALDFIRRNKDRPFLLWLSHFAVHSPYQAKQEKVAHFRGKPGVGGHNDPVYAAMISSLDESVGRVVKAIDDLGLGPSTLLIFSSDNGGVGGYVAAGVPAKEGVTDNAPLRGGKGMLYEGGVRVPFIFRWKDQIKPGTVCEEPIISVDVLPTLAALAGAEGPFSEKTDGLNLLPLLHGRVSSLSRDALYWHFPGYLGSGPNIWRTTPAGAIRHGDFKLIEFFEDGRLELYDLRCDQGQKHNLVSERPGLAGDLHGRLKRWREEIGAPMPVRRLPRTGTAKRRSGAPRHTRAVSPLACIFHTLSSVRKGVSSRDRGICGLSGIGRPGLLCEAVEGRRFEQRDDMQRVRRFCVVAA